MIRRNRITEMFEGIDLSIDKAVSNIEESSI